MQLTETNIAEKIQNLGIRFEIPPFQRAYSWDEENWLELFDDLKNVIRKHSKHFMGAVVVQKTSNNRLIIDGQQRLTTCLLLLLALAKWIKKNDNGNTFLYKKTILYFLAIELPNGQLITKIDLSKKNDNDREFGNLILEFYSPNYVPIKIEKEYLGKAVRFFEGAIDEYYHSQDWEEVSFFSQIVFDSITKQLSFIEIELSENEDANTIFETLNSRGKQLESSDLIRNHIFMLEQVRKANAEQIYKNHWCPLEEYFEKDIPLNFSDFLRYFLFAHVDSSDTIRKDRIYPEMKDFLGKFLQDNSIGKFFEKLHLYKGFLDFIINPTDETKNFYSKKINIALSVIKYTEVMVSMPFILKSFELHHDQKIQKQTLESILLLLASYTLRLVVHEKKFPNKVIPPLIIILDSFVKGDDEKKLLQKIEEKITSLKASPFYDDETFKAKFLEYEIYYHSKRKNLIRYIIWLAIFQHSSQNLAYSISDLSIEHIMPQNMSKQGITEQEINEFKKLIHTIGNLTLITQRLNSDLGNLPFKDKRKKLSEYSIWKYETEIFFNQDIWTKENIWERSTLITEQIVKILPQPHNNSQNPEEERVGKRKN